MDATTETKQEGDTSPFVLPRTLDEWLVSAVFVAWPLIFIFVLAPNMEINAAGEALSWLAAFVIQVGIFYGLQTARRRGR
jgi:hypothetical protein